MKPFTGPDGHYSIEVKGRTLVFVIDGVVDMEMALRYMLEFKIKVTELAEPYWASLVDLSSWGLHPPDIVHFIHEFHDWAEQNGQLAEAAVVNSSVLKVMARNKLIEKRGKMVHQEYFKTHAEAVEWLQHLYLYEED
jgi:hypothetical protein